MLKGKVAIITGASYGMGRTMAELFAEEGAALVITARHQEKLDEVVDGIRAKGGKAVGVVADVCATEDTQRVFETALKEFGDVDILTTTPESGSRRMIDEDRRRVDDVCDEHQSGRPHAVHPGGAEDLSAQERWRDHQHFLSKRHPALLRGHLHRHQKGR